MDLVLVGPVLVNITAFSEITEDVRRHPIDHSGLVTQDDATVVFRRLVYTNCERVKQPQLECGPLDQCPTC